MMYNISYTTLLGSQFIFVVQRVAYYLLKDIRVLSVREAFELFKRRVVLNFFTNSTTFKQELYNYY